MREEKVRVYYNVRRIDTRRVDFVVEGCLVEIKAKREFDPEDYIQTLSYLKASGYRLGLLVNFGGKRAQFQGLVNSQEVRECGDLFSSHSFLSRHS